MPLVVWLYVALLYALAVRLARVPKGVALLFFALVFVFLPKGAVTIIPADVIRLVPPWSELRAPGRAPWTKYDVSNLNLHDVPMQIVPWMEQVRASWKSLDVPLWNPLNGTGMPLLANGQSTPFSPFRLLTLPLSLSDAMTAEAAMKLLLALTLTFLFCRRRYSVGASVLAAVAYGFSTWMTTWLQFPIAAAAAFLPGILLVIDRCAGGTAPHPALRATLSPQAGRGATGGEAATIGEPLPFSPARGEGGRRPDEGSPFIAAVAMFTLAVLSGHPETIYNIGLIAAAYGIWIAPRVRPLLRIAGASLVAALLCGPFLVPFAEAVLRSQRFSEVQAPRETLVPPYSDFPSAILLLQPNFFGELPIERPWGPTGLESVCGFAGVLAIAAVIAAAIDLILRRRWRERETLYLLGFVFCLGVVLGWPVITEVFAKIAAHAPPMRMRLGLCWFGSVLVAAAVDRARRDGAAPLLLGGACVAAAMLWLLRTTAFPTESHRATAVLSLLPSLAVLFVLTLVRVRGAVTVLTALTVVELMVVMARWNPRLERRELYPPSPLVAAIGRDARMVGLGGQLYPNTNAMFDFEDVRVHDPMAWSRYVDFLTRTVRWDSLDYYAKWDDAGTPLLDYLNVKYVVTEPARQLAAPRYVQRYAGRDGRVYENRNVLPRFFAVRNVLPGGDVATHTDWQYTAIVERLPRRWSDVLTAPREANDARVQLVSSSADEYRLRVHAPRATLVVSSIPNYPGWRVRGGEVIEVNHAFVGIIVPPGEHEVEVAYRPMTFWIPAAVALATLAALLVLARRRALRRPR